MRQKVRKNNRNAKVPFGKGGPLSHHLCNCEACEEEALENSGDLPSQSFRHLRFFVSLCLCLVAGLSLQERIGVT